MVSTAVFNGVAAIVLLAVALIGAYAPVYLHKKGGRSLLYVLGNMLSAGVMISAGLVHLLGQAMQDLQAVTTFPLAPFLCGTGFIVTLFADHAASILTAGQGWEVARCGSMEDKEPLAQSVNSENSSSLEHNSRNDIEMGSTFSNSLVNGSVKPSVDGGAADTDMSKQNRSLVPERWKGGAETSLRIKPLTNGQESSDGQSVHLAENEEQDLNRPHSPNSHLEAVTPTENKAGALAMSLGSSDGQPQISFITAVLMAVALCLHSVLEGTAMGAQSNVVDTAHIFIAIVAHKGLAAYALGSSVLESGVSRQRFWIVTGVFAAATPVGIGFGRLVANVAEGGPAAALSALASGTFLYVAFMEVIPKEMHSPDHGISKLCTLLLGFGAMSVLALWA